MDAGTELPDTGFLEAAAPSPGADRIFAEDREQMGFVMDLSHAWAHVPAEHDALTALLGRTAETAGLTRRDRGLLVAAAAGVRRDPPGSLAWGARLAEEIGDDAAAGVLGGDDTDLEPRDAALAAWARRVARDPNGTGPADVQRLRDAGFDDRQIAALTLYTALRLAFSTVNQALGARPDRPLRDAAPIAVRSAVTYGRPVAAGGPPG
jgi:alkylhydroperoxidase family enzyme